MTDEHQPEPRPEPSRIQLDKSSASKAFAWSMLFSVVSKVVFPLAGLYIVRTLGPETMGAFSLMMTIVGFSEVLRDAGLTQTYLALPSVDRKKDGSYLMVALSTGLLFAAILAGSSAPLSRFFGLPDLSWSLAAVAFAVLMNGASTIPRAKMLREGHIKRYGLVDLIGSGLGLAIAISMVAMGYGFVALVVQVVFASLYMLVVSWASYPVRTINLGIDAFREVGRKSLAVLAANGINNLFLFADHTVINKFAGTISNGYFGQATNLAYKPADLFVFPLTRTLMVAFSQSAVDQDRLARVYARSLTVAILVVLPIYAFLGAFADPIIRLLLTSKFEGSIPIFSAMCLYLSIRVLGNISGYALVPAGKHFQTFYPWLVAAVATGAAVFATVRAGGPFPNSSLLMPIVWCFVGGAFLVYTTLLWLGVRYCKPIGEERVKLFRAIYSLAASCSAIALIRTLPISGNFQLAAAAIVGPILHLGFVGTFFARKPLYYLNRTGPKRLWSEL